MALQTNRLLACKHRTIFLTYGMNYYSPSSYTTSTANKMYPFLGHANGEDTLAKSPNPFSTPLFLLYCKIALVSVFPVQQNWVVT